MKWYNVVDVICVLIVEIVFFLNRIMGNECKNINLYMNWKMLLKRLKYDWFWINWINIFIKI